MTADTVKSELYYPEEETSNQMTPTNRDKVEQDRAEALEQHSRFYLLNNTQDFIYSFRSDNTKKKTTYDLKI